MNELLKYNHRKSVKREDAIMKRRTFLSLMGAAALTSSMMLTGCGVGTGDDRKIVRIGHVQSQTHPDHLGLEAFANYINEKLGDKYRVEVYPSELLAPRPKWCS